MPKRPRHPQLGGQRKLLAQIHDRRRARSGRLVLVRRVWRPFLRSDAQYRRCGQVPGFDSYRRGAFHRRPELQTGMGSQ